MLVQIRSQTEKIMQNPYKLNDFEHFCMNEAFKEAQMAMEMGNLPIGCVITLGNEIIARGKNRILYPSPNPWNHAECEALRQLSQSHRTRFAEMTLFTTLEPCLMCMGTLVLHEIGRVIYGACDIKGGGSYMMKQLPAFYQDRRVPVLIGPVDPARGDALYREADKRFPACQM